MSNRIRNLIKRVKKLIQRIRFGEIKEQVMTTAGDNITAEVKYTGRKGKTIGYWAYGYFDPNLPYKG